MPLLIINSFHSEICPFVLLLKINSFLFGVCPFILCQISTPSFLGFASLYFAKYQLLPFWLRLRPTPLYLCTIIHIPSGTPLGRDVLGQEGRDVPAITLIGLSTSRWIEAPTIGLEYKGSLTWAGIILTIFPLLGRDVSDHTSTSVPLGS